MSLRVLFPGVMPASFDGLDSEYLTLKGGEVVSLTSVLLSAKDLAAADVNDGYFNTTTQRRPVVTKTLTTGMRMLMLADEGTSDYGTLLGTLVGGVTGQISLNGTVLGPSTAAGSGKVTCWDKPGIYAVSLDNVDTTAGTGLIPTNGSLTVGSALYATAAGLLTPNSSASFEAGVVVGHFIEFALQPSLVTTPSNLAAPYGASSPANFKWAIFRFEPNV